MKRNIKARLDSVQSAIQYMQSGEVLIGLKSLKSNNKYVYQIRESTNGKRFFVNMIAISGEPGFMGIILDGQFQRTDKSRVAPQAPAFIAFAWLWQQLCANKLPDTVELYAIE
jgi:hypothetical protein